MEKSPERVNTGQTGFTLIELMIVIAILGILASIAISSYQDYTIRGRVSEATQMVNPVTVAVGTYYWVNSVLPTSRTAAGQLNVITKYIEGITITAAGLISVDLNESTTGISSKTADNMYLIFTPDILTSVGAIDWTCSANNAVDGTGNNTNLSRFVPSNCR